MFRIRAVQMENLRGLLGIMRIGKVPNMRIRVVRSEERRGDERIDEIILRWFGHFERMENTKIAKRVYVGMCG